MLASYTPRPFDWARPPPPPPMAAASGLREAGTFLADCHEARDHVDALCLFTIAAHTQVSISYKPCVQRRNCNGLSHEPQGQSYAPGDPPTPERQRRPWTVHTMTTHMTTVSVVASPLDERERQKGWKTQAAEGRSRCTERGVTANGPPAAHLRLASWGQPYGPCHHHRWLPGTRVKHAMAYMVGVGLPPCPQKQ
jgi:hypothetical protein